METRYSSILGALAASLAIMATAQAQPVGPCAWDRLPQGEQDAFYAAYRTGIQAGMAYLSSREAELSADVLACTGRSDVPKLWAQGAVGATAIQYGAARMLGSRPDLTRSALDGAWDRGPEAARQCIRANAAKAFGLTDQPCPDRKAPPALLQKLAISPTTDRAMAVQALYYFNAKAQDQWAEALIARFKTKPPTP